MLTAVVVLQAIDSFLKSMKLTVDDVKANPALAAAVVGYHGERHSYTPERSRHAVQLTTCGRSR